jgi:tight adherence protein C
MFAWFNRLIRRLAEFAGDRRGVAAVEMAVVMPLFLLMFSGLVEVGRAYEQANAIEKAEEKAARLPAIMTIPLIIFILPALFVVVLGPAILSIADSFMMR